MISAGNLIIYLYNAENICRYINGLAKAIEKRGGKIYEQTSAMKCEANEVSTTDGVTVKADAVVMATNSPLNHNLLVHARQSAYHTYAIGLKIPKGSVPYVSTPFVFVFNVLQVSSCSLIKVVERLSRS